MAIRQLGSAPSAPTHTATKGYVDTAVLDAFTGEGITGDLNSAPMGYTSYAQAAVTNHPGLGDAMLLTMKNEDDSARMQYSYSVTGDYAVRFRLSGTWGSWLYFYDGHEAWTDITGKPSTFAPIVGTGAADAKAGNYVPTWAEITSKPTTFAPVVGTGAADAKAGNYVPGWTEITSKPSTFAPIIGSGAGDAVAGNDARLTDARTPTAHTHPTSEVTGLDTALGLKAPLASPTFTGTPAAPTAAGGTNTTQVATTAFVKAAADAKVTDAIADAVTDIAPSQNAVFDALALKAPLASPALTGNPTAPTQTAGNNSTRVATTAYADAKVAETITNGTTGIAPSQDAVFDALALKAPLASPALTGTPTAPTAAAANNSTQVATTAYVDSAATTAANAKVTDAIADAVTTVAPSQNAVFDALALKAPLASPAFTGTPTGITKSHVGLGSVDNTADNAKAVLSATKLTTARTINGVSFDGQANIAITLPWCPEMVCTSGAVVDGYNDMPGGISVEPGISAAGVILDSVWVRLGDLAATIGTGALTVDIYGGTATTQGTLLVSLSMAAGVNNQIGTLGSPQALAANAVVRAYFTKGTAVVTSPIHVQLRGRYA